MTAAAAPILVSVIALAVHDLTRRTVAEQGQLRAQIEKLLQDALQALPAAQRIVLDAPQGFAVAVLDGRHAALELAERVQTGAAELPLCIGINYGPVAIMEDANRGHALFGDGVTAAMTMTQAAAPGRMIASRPFHEALQAEAPDSAARLIAAGVHTDAQVRTHEIFTLDQHAAHTRRRRLVITGAAAFAGILALGVVARMAVQGGWLQPAPAVIEFNITPRGDVYVDGVLKGTSPPLSQLEVAPGKHVIEIRNSRFPPLTIDINPVAAEKMTITHSFGSKSAGPKGEDKSLRENAREGWRSFRKGIGF